MFPNYRIPRSLCPKALPSSPSGLCVLLPDSAASADGHSVGPQRPDPNYSKHWTWSTRFELLLYNLLTMTSGKSLNLL